MNQLLKKPGVHKNIFSRDDRRYSIYVPEGIAEQKDPSLIMLLHWGGPVYPFKGLEILSGLGIPSFAGLEAIIASPDCPAGRWDNSTSESYVMELYRWLLEQYEIENQKTLLAGYSLGGIGTWYIAARNQNEFAGALIVSAVPLDESVNVRWPMPIRVIHSKHDEVFRFEDTVKTVDLLKKRKVSIDLRVVEGVTHYDTYGFIEPLKNSVPWIENVWSQNH